MGMASRVRGAWMPRRSQPSLNQVPHPVDENPLSEAPTVTIAVPWVLLLAMMSPEACVKPRSRV